MSKFLTAAMSHDALTQNGALSHSTSGNFVLDYFAKCGSYRGRQQGDVNSDMAKIFGEDIPLALKTVFYNRMVTRKVKGEVSTENVQKGQGQRDEFIKTLRWLEQNRPELLYSNLHLVPYVGCWRDLWYDSPATGEFYYVNPNRVYALIKLALTDEYNRGLIAKYLPKIRSASNVKTDRHRRLNNWAKGLCKFLGISEKEYRKLKSDPENSAHLFQRQMCAGEWDSLNFKSIPGKALFKLLNSKKGNAFERHGQLDRYSNWLDTQPVAKFTGYVYELYSAAKNRSSLVQRKTYDKQFDGLMQLAEDSVAPELLQKGVLCALDTSGSMSCGYYGSATNVAPIDICVSLGIYFSKLLKGAFADHVIMFDNESKFLKLKGTFCDRCDQIAQQGWAMGSTNFQSVIDAIVDIRKKKPNIPVEDFPGVLLVVSDMQFNPVSGYYDDYYSEGTSAYNRQVETNYEAAMRKLEDVGLPRMTVIWWNVNAEYGNDVPSKMDDEGTVLISGFDPAIVTAILGGDEVVDKVTGEKRKATAYEQMLNALDQEILNMLQT